MPRIFGKTFSTHIMDRKALVHQLPEFFVEHRGGYPQVNAVYSLRAASPNILFGTRFVNYLSVLSSRLSMYMREGLYDRRKFFVDRTHI